MRERLELLVNLWTFGVPVIVVTWGVLRLMVHAPGRVRYLFAIGGFVAVLVVPFVGSSAPSARGKAAAEPPHSIVAAADVLAAPVNFAWGAVAMLLLLRDAIGHARLRRTRRALHAAPAELKRGLQWPEHIALLVGDHPFTVGLLRPAVVVPLDAPMLDRIAKHELSHARWRDPLVFAVLRVIAAVFWVSPAWLVLRWVRREREAAADAAALHGTSGEEASYVEALVRLSRPARELAAAMAASDLEYRARRILAPQRGPALALLALFGGALLLSMAAPARLEADEPAAVVVRWRQAIAAEPAPVVTTAVIPAETPPPLPPAKRKPAKRRAEARAEAAEDVHVHVDVDRHVHVDVRD